MYPSVTKDTRVRRVYGLVDYLHKIKTSVYSAVLQSYPKQTCVQKLYQQKIKCEEFQGFQGTNKKQGG